MDHEPDGDQTHTHLILTPGTKVSHYQIVKKVGAGGMGEVYLAEDTKLKRQVALKFLSHVTLDAPDSRTRFVNEARAAAALEHANICPVYEIDEAEGRMFIAMAFVDGQSLREKTQSGPLKLEDVSSLGIDIARGLQEAHENSITHRDIKSANVMVNSKGQAKITDFGLAKLAGGSGLTKTGTTMGTAAYMSPEQVRGEPVDRRSDIWSLGIILYEMVTGRLPFAGDSEHAVTHQIVHEENEPITGVRSGVPMELERVVNKCLQKDASNRYQHADDLIVDLLNVGKGPSRTAATPGSLRKFAFPTLVVLLAAILFFLKPYYWPSGAQIFENPLADATFRRITDLAGSKDAAISPDGQFIAFVSDHEGEFDIWVSQVESGSIFNRTGGKYGDMRRGLQDVGFSANSSHILSFATSHGAPITSMPLLDGPMRNILRDSVILADWSPDGRRVVYFTDSPGDPVFVANADGTNRREILSADAGMHQHYERWSVDGEWIYLTRGREGIWENDLWRVRSDGSQLEQLTTDQVDVSYPAPLDERIVLFIASDETGGGPWIWAVDVETKLVQRVTTGLEKYGSLSISRDRRRLATTVINSKARLLSLWQVPILDSMVTETGASRLNVQAQRSHAPRFGGSAIYFLSARGTGDGLWKYEDGQLAEIWNGAKSALFEVPIVSPDGKSIAIVLKRDGARHLHYLGSDGSNLRLLSSSIDVRGTGDWSHDGQWIVIGGIDTAGYGLFKISIEGDYYERIMAGDAINPVWSPQGDMIVYSGTQVGGFSYLKAIRPDGSRADFPEIRCWVRGERYRFLPDGSGLVYTQGWFAGQDFWLLDLTSMESRQMTELAKGARTRTFDISPDGQTIIFDRSLEKADIVLIEIPIDSTGP